MEKEQFNVEHWRERFAKVRVALGKNWRSQLLNANKDLNNDSGRRLIQTVAHNKGSLINTITIVEKMEMLEKAEKEEAVLNV